MQKNKQKNTTTTLQNITKQNIVIQFNKMCKEIIFMQNNKNALQNPGCF